MKIETLKGRVLEAIKTLGDVESLMSPVMKCFMGLTVGSKLVGVEVLNCIW